MNMLNTFAFAVALSILQSAAPQNGKFDDSRSNSPPFKAVGVRGAVDAGGYAASAEAKTQSEFYEQLADLQIASLHVCSYADAQQAAAAPMFRGDFAAAVTALEAEVRTTPGPATRELLGLAYEATGQLAAAGEQFRLAALAQPTDSGAATAYAIALLLEGDSDHAAKVRGASPLCIGAALFRQGRVSEALDLFLKNASERPSECAPFGFIATSVRAADPAVLNHAIASLLLLAQQAPANGIIHYALACAKSAEDKTQTAEIELQLRQAVKLTPTLADAHFRLGAICAEREDLLAAIGEYQIAIQCNSRLIECHYRLGQLHNRTGEPERAKKELDLYRQLRAQQKNEIESGRVPVRLSPCP